MRTLDDALASCSSDASSQVGVVEAATKDYRSTQDVVGAFIEDRCVTGPMCSMQGGKLYAASAGLVGLATTAIAPAGGALPHNNLQPYLTVNFCIALQGVFPPRD